MSISGARAVADQEKRLIFFDAKTTQLVQQSLVSDGLGVLVE